MLQSARKFLRTRSPDWLNVEIDRDFWKNLRSRSVSTKSLSTNQRAISQNNPKSHRPHHRRITQVYQLLDLAHKSGIVSYAALIDYVRSATGKGCSRKLISKWKKERGWR